MNKSCSPVCCELPRAQLKLMRNNQMYAKKKTVISFMRCCLFNNIMRKLNRRKQWIILIISEKSRRLKHKIKGHLTAMPKN